MQVFMQSVCSFSPILNVFQFLRQILVKVPNVTFLATP
jgi:hypothetical protein